MLVNTFGLVSICRRGEVKFIIHSLPIPSPPRNPRWKLLSNWLLLTYYFTLWNTIFREPSTVLNSI